jgi:SAM-dependent methyltransferase
LTKNFSKENLKKDRKVLGKAWNKTYNSYFGNIQNINYFIEKALPLLPKKTKLKILYPCSAAGLLGEELVKALAKKGIGSGLTLVEISKEHLNQNKNPKTKKNAVDVLAFQTKEKFGAIIMRSSLDYFPTRKIQVKLLSKISRLLEHSGIFINQMAVMPSEEERKLADKIYNSNKKIGKRHFQLPKEIKELYENSGFCNVRKIGDASKLVITEKEHSERYALGRKEIQKIRNLILKIPAKKRPSIKTTKKGYALEFAFPIFTASKKP